MGPASQISAATSSSSGSSSRSASRGSSPGSLANTTRHPCRLNGVPNHRRCDVSRTMAKVWYTQHSVTPYVTASVVAGASRSHARRRATRARRSPNATTRRFGKQSVPSGVGTVPSMVGVVVTCVAADARRHAPRFAKTSARDAVAADVAPAAPSRKNHPTRDRASGATYQHHVPRGDAVRGVLRLAVMRQRGARRETRLSVDPCSRT